jgi:hypothetical protein
METQIVFETLLGNSIWGEGGSVDQKEILVHLLMAKASNLTCY